LTPVAILIAAVFWTWLWGAVGLLLATPLTVCLAVVGRYVPRLEFLRILLTDEPVLRPHTRFYQRLLGGNVEEATEVAEEFMKGKSLEDFADMVVIPALSLVEEDRHRGNLDEEKQQSIFQNVRMLIEDVAERSEELIAGSKEKKETETHTEKARTERPLPVEEAAVVCVPARDEADELAALMLEYVLRKRRIPVRVLSCASLAGECVEQLRRSRAGVACVTVVPPFGQLNARYMCRRLHAQFPELKIIAAILTEHPVEELKARGPALAAEETTTTIKQCVTAVLSYLPTSDEIKQAA
jgi:hypothetical protein